MSFGEVDLNLFRLFLLIDPIGRLEYFNYEPLELVIVPGLVLSLGLKMQMRSRKPSNSLNLGLYSLLCCGHSTMLTE
jgi:hypothetical protein